jgi:hypothetical protein
VQIQEVGVHVGTPQDGISELRRWCGDGVGRRTVMEVDNFVQDKRLKAAGASAISREINDLGKERRTEPSHTWPGPLTSRSYALSRSASVGRSSRSPLNRDRQPRTVRVLVQHISRSAAAIACDAKSETAWPEGFAADSRVWRQDVFDVAERWRRGEATELQFASASLAWG